MGGNVLEWCCTKWRQNYEDHEARVADDDLDGDDARVVRGGCFNYSARYCRSAYRCRYEPDNRSFSLGFRPVRIPGQQGWAAQ
jgi:formylglycine-generating enzyme required for sulfatase activity